MSNRINIKDLVNAPRIPLRTWQERIEMANGGSFSTVINLSDIELADTTIGTGVPMGTGVPSEDDAGVGTRVPTCTDAVGPAPTIENDFFVSRLGPPALATDAERHERFRVACIYIAVHYWETVTGFSVSRFWRDRRRKIRELADDLGQAVPSERTIARWTKEYRPE